MAEPAVVAIVVNYNTSELALECVGSLRAQEVALPDGSEGVKTIVVDNASHPEERARLRESDCPVLYNDHNVGYGAAVNQASARSPAKLLLFTNADTLYLPGSLQAAAVELVTHARCGAVGPRRQWDEAGELLLPPNEATTPWTELGQAAASRVAALEGARQRLWTRRALRYWTATEPIVRPVLSGASMLTRRDVLEQVGGFDERFHLYFEDADWCRRARRRGYELRCVPAARVVHFYNQSAKLVAHQASQTFDRSSAAYLGKHYGRTLPYVTARVATSLERRPQPHPDEINLGRPTEPPALSTGEPAGGPSLFLFSPHPSCVPSAGAVTPRPSLRLPGDVWARLAPGMFHARLLSLPDLAVTARWRWEKGSTALPERPPTRPGGARG